MIVESGTAADVVFAKFRISLPGCQMISSLSQTDFSMQSETRPAIIVGFLGQMA